MKYGQVLKRKLMLPVWQIRFIYSCWYKAETCWSGICFCFGNRP